MQITFTSCRDRLQSDVTIQRVKVAWGESARDLTSNAQ